MRFTVLDVTAILVPLAVDNTRFSTKDLALLTPPLSSPPCVWFFEL